jgi:hypothetical protein
MEKSQLQSGNTLLAKISEQEKHLKVIDSLLHPSTQGLALYAGANQAGYNLLEPALIDAGKILVKYRDGAQRKLNLLRKEFANL